MALDAMLNIATHIDNGIKLAILATNLTSVNDDLNQHGTIQRKRH